MFLDTTGISVLEGQTFRKVTKLNEFDSFENEGIVFIGKETFYLTHDQSCCERVWIEDICGDLKDLENTPIISAKEITNKPKSEELLGQTNYALEKFNQRGQYMHEQFKEFEDENASASSTWTFFKFRTIKGSVTVRFFGTSNGYYSESASLIRI